MREGIMNGIIKRTFIGREDHGILTANITIEGESWGCGFGWLMPSHLHSFIEAVVDLLGCSWEDLPGKMVRVQFEPGTGMVGIQKVGHPIKDEWIDKASICKKKNAT